MKEAMICVRQNGVVLAQNKITSSHTQTPRPASWYDATGDVLMHITNPIQYKRIIEKMYARLLAFSPRVDYQYMYDRPYTSTMLLFTSAPIDVIHEQISTINKTQVGMGMCITDRDDMSTVSSATYTSIQTPGTFTTTDVQSMIDASNSAIQETQRDMCLQINQIKTQIGENMLIKRIENLESQLDDILDRLEVAIGKQDVQTMLNRKVSLPRFSSMSDISSTGSSTKKGTDTP